MHVVLVGPMAAGKSTVARVLASRLGWPVRDSDEDLQAERGFSGRELAASAGVGVLHRWECAHLRRSVADPTPSVVAAAASVVDDALCREALLGQFVVWLRASAEERVARTAAAPGSGGSGAAAEADHRRELGPDPVRALADIDAPRREAYAAVADLVVDTEHATPDRIVDTICSRLPAGRGPEPLARAMPGSRGRGDLRS